MTATTERTLPELAAAWGVTLDPLRRLVRTDPQLARLGRRFGPTRVFSADEARQIKQAFDARQAAK